MTNLAPVLSTTSVPAVPQPRGLLFGEVGPGDLHAGLAGHGIGDIHTAKAPPPNPNGTLGRRQRSFSYTDAEPSSPSDWYRNVTGEHEGTGAVGANVIPSAPKHVRSRSELGFTKPVQQQSKSARSLRPKPRLDTSVLPSTSKIPVSVRKYSTPSSSSSPNSTRSNSPSTVRKPFPHGKKINANQNQRTKTPSPLAAPAIKRPHKPSAISANGSTRLNAFISAPLPKLSPPLRSSRPRQPVSSASTISSRVKAIERDKSPTKRDPRANAKGNEPSRRRKISLGPIDYESRREQIKLSYTKSIRENEARAVTRKAAQERKRREEAKALVAQVAATEASKHEEEVQIELAEEDVQILAEGERTAPEEPISVRITTPDLTMGNTASVEVHTSDLPHLQTVTTNLGANEVHMVSGETVHEKDSPTLGMPGSFPSAEVARDEEDAPHSAVSNTTEFDAEPQTDPPVQECIAVTTQDSHGVDDYHQPISQKAEYRSPFEDEAAADDGLSIQIALDTSAELLTAPGDVSEASDSVNPSQEVPSTYQEPYEVRPSHSPSYETKVTILGSGGVFSLPALDTHDCGAEALAPGQQEPGSSNGQDHPYTASITIPDTDPAEKAAEQTEPSSGLSEIAEFFVGPALKYQGQRQEFTDPQVHADTEVEEMSSAQQDSEDLRYSLDSKRTLETHRSLTVPRTSESMNRASQTTVWTDFSMNSQDSSSGYNPLDQDPQRVAFTWREELADSETDSRSESYHLNRSSMAMAHSRDVSPRGTYREPDLYEPQHQLPEIDTGEEFGTAILSSKSGMGSAAIPVLPSHAPPPPPSDDASYHDVMTSAAPSEYYDDTRPNSYVDNERDHHRLVLVDSLKRESDYFAPTESASRSMDQGSLATSEEQEPYSQMTSQQTLVESINVEQIIDIPAKERKRLFTRLETIKELIDTETFFIRDMNIVEEIYKGTAEACPKLDDKTIKLIFRNTNKIIQFHSAFLVELKEGVSSIYIPRTHRHVQKDTCASGDGSPLARAPTAASAQVNDDKDRATSLGPIFIRNIENMKQVHETFLKNSDHASKQLIQIQEDPTVQVWLNECNEVARELTRAWNLDSLLIKPMQRITKYPNLLIQLLHETPADHPDRAALEAAKTAVEDAIEEINKTKKNFELVGQIVSRRRKESDVKAGFARAFGKRVDRLQPASNKPSEDPEYLKLHEKFGDDYLRLQVVLRDVEFYTRQVTDYVHEFLQYLSSIELVMRIQPSPHPEIESKWVRFNVSMRDLEKVALEQHVSNSNRCPHHYTTDMIH